MWRGTGSFYRATVAVTGRTLASWYPLFFALRGKSRSVICPVRLCGDGR